MEGNKLLDGLRDKLLEDISSCLVAKITKIHNDKKVDVKPLYKVNGKSIPQIVHVPLLFLGNNDNIINVESQVGDYVVVIMSDYDIDNLAISGQEKEVNTNAKHEVNNALAIPFSFTPFNQNKNQSRRITIKNNGEIEIQNDKPIYIKGDMKIDSGTRIFVKPEPTTQYIDTWSFGSTAVSNIDTNLGTEPDPYYREDYFE